MSLFSFPMRTSECKIVLTGGEDEQDTARFARVHVTAGYSDYQPNYHMIGLNLGVSLPILYQRDRHEQHHNFAHRHLFFSPLGASLQSAHAVTTDIFYLYLSASFIDATAHTIGIDKRQVELYPNFNVYDPVIGAIGDQVLHELTQPELGGRLVLDSLKTQLAVHVLRRYNADSSSTIHDLEAASFQRRELRSAVEYIHAHLDQDLSLAAIAQSEHFSPHHFLRLFKKIYGVSPHQYIIQKRVERATELLKNPKRTVSDVALEVGFHSHSHLSRHYKRLTGKTPRPQK